MCFFAVAGSRLENIEQPVFAFVDNFCEQLKSLVEHDFIAKKQADYLKNLKEKLGSQQLIAIMDFSENLAFEIQNAVQSYYYAKQQCTLHPICLYYKENNELKQRSIIIIAESLKHNVEAVYLFQSKLVEYLKKTNEFKTKNEIIFFTDGAASQYKNKKNFLNLCLFEKDFNLKSEWHFFATSHGKSPCDALGGTFKRTVRMHNMKETMGGITNPKDLFEWTKTLVDSKVHFIYCDEEMYDETYKNLHATRFDQKIRTIVGTHSLHSFTPLNENTISAKTISDSEEIKINKLF